jgi:tRNA-splicing ligase RtcB
MIELFSDKKQLHPVKIWRNYITEVEHGCIQQAINASNHPALFSHVALAPDCHQGYGLPVGGIAAFDGVVIPNAVGVDIACGMLSFNTGQDASDYTYDDLLDIVKEVKKIIPMGPKHQKTDKWLKKAQDLVYKYQAKCIDHDLEDNPNITVAATYAQLGTLGGGNHFIEFQENEEGKLNIMIHSGSRNLGHRVAKYYHQQAKELCNKWKISLPTTDLAYLPVDTLEGGSYLNDMKFCENFSFENRICMLRDILYLFAAKNGKFPYSRNAIMNTASESFTKDLGAINIHHNYAALENHFGKNVWVHRKGATSAKKNELGIIPGSMGSFSYIVKGKGNPMSFMSCSHHGRHCFS